MTLVLKEYSSVILCDKEVQRRRVTYMGDVYLSSNTIGPGGTERLGGVLVQCTGLAHLNLSYNRNVIKDVGGGRFRTSWCGQTSVLVL